MLTLHAGMPKTGTTAFQAALTAHQSALAAAGLLYPADFRNAEGIAHHALSAAVVASPKDSATVDRFLALLAASKSERILVSSEAFTNALAPRQLPGFLAVLDQASALRPLRVVIALRRIDDFLESMYLQSVKVGEITEDLMAYVERRRSWMGGLIAGLAAVRARFGADAVVAIRYNRGADFASQLASAMGVQDGLVPADTVGRTNLRLGLKAQVALLHLGELAALLGVPIDRFRLLRNLENGRFAFEGDTTNYALLPRDVSVDLHRDALAAAAATGEHAYADFFRDEAIPSRVATTLDYRHLTERDIDHLRDHLAGVDG